MNIWYLSAHDQPRGHSARTYDFCSELVKRGHRVTMFTNSYCHWTHTERLAPGEKWRLEKDSGIRVVWLRTIHYTGNGLRRGLNMISNARRSLQVAGTLPDMPDVVIGPSVPLGTGWAAARIARKKRAAFVFEVRDVWPIALVDDGGLSKTSPIYFMFRQIEKSLYRSAQRISATVPFLFNHVAASGGDPSKVTWIPNGVNFDLFSGCDEYTGGKVPPLVVMYVGGFGNAHDVITIVKAAALLRREAPQAFHFVIVGDGPKRAACEIESAMHGLTNVEFRDPVPKSAVPALLCQADILIACVTKSLAYRFGLNLNKIFDYFASARPVIFSGSAPNDPIAETKAGFSIPPEDPDAMADALKKLRALSPEDRIDMGKRGRRYVKDNFDMRQLAERMERVLLQAIEAKGDR